MVYTIDTVVELKKAVARVIGVLDQGRDNVDLWTAFGQLSELWNSPGVALFRRSYGNAAASMPDGKYLEVWRDVIEYMNDAQGKLMRVGQGRSRDGLLLAMGGMDTALDKVRVAHIDDINESYVARS